MVADRETAGPTGYGAMSIEAVDQAGKKNDRARNQACGQARRRQVCEQRG